MTTNVPEHIDVLHDYLIDAARELLNLQKRPDVSSMVREPLRACGRAISKAIEEADTAFDQAEEEEPKV